METGLSTDLCKSVGRLDAVKLKGRKHDEMVLTNKFPLHTSLKLLILRFRQCNDNCSQTLC